METDELEPSSMLNLRHLEIFYAIMITGSVTGAARMLAVSQPAVTAMLKHAESTLQMQLFIRKGGRLTPTKEAGVLFPDVAAMFQRLHAIERRAKDLAGGRLGSLAVAASFPLTIGFLAKALATFMLDHEGVRVTLRSLTSPEVLQSIMVHEVELGIVQMPFSNEDLQTEILGNWSMGCALPKWHPLADKDEIHIKDLADWPIITYLPQLIFRPYIDQAFKEFEVTPKIAAEVSSALTAIVLAGYGPGVAVVDTMVLSSLKFPNIVAKRLVPDIQSQTVLLSSKKEARSLMASIFVEHLKRQLVTDGLRGVVQ